MKPPSDLPDNVHRDADVYAQFGSISGRNALMSISPYKHRESRIGTANKSKVDASDQKALEVAKENQTPNRSNLKK